MDRDLKIVVVGRVAWATIVSWQDTISNRVQWFGEGNNAQRYTILTRQREQPRLILSISATYVLPHARFQSPACGKAQTLHGFPHHFALSATKTPFSLRAFGTTHAGAN